MKVLVIVAIVAVLIVALLAVLSIRVVYQYQRGVLFRLGRVVAVRNPGLNLIVPIIDRLQQVSMSAVS